MTTFAPTAIRASEMARCVRMAALRGRGAEQVEHDEQTRRFFARGHLYTEYVARQLMAKHGKDAVEQEVEIEWPLGVGHADIYVKPAKLLVEVKSTVTPSVSSPMFDMSVQQLRIYMRFHPEAERGALYLVNPSDLRAEDVFEVKLTDVDIAEIDLAVAQVKDAVERGLDLPDRVCQKPSDARGRLCPFADPCFEGWEPPPPTAIEDDPEAREHAATIYHLEQEIKAKKGEVSALEGQRAYARSQLGPKLEAGVEYEIGPLSVKRIEVAPRVTYRTAAAIKTGVVPEQALEGYVNVGEPSERWYVKRVGDGPVDDFGDQAPW